jgi:hypothetical protein
MEYQRHTSALSLQSFIQSHVWYSRREAKRSKLQNPKSNLQRQQNTFAAATKSNEAAF